MSAHNLCFGSKIRKVGIPLYNSVLLYKSGVLGGIHYTDMLSKIQYHDVLSFMMIIYHGCHLVATKGIYQVLKVGT